MVKKKKVTKKSPKKVEDTLSALSNLDKNISKAMKNMSGSINISISLPQETPKKKKKAVKKKK